MPARSRKPTPFPVSGRHAAAPAHTPPPSRTPDSRRADRGSPAVHEEATPKENAVERDIVVFKVRRDAKCSECSDDLGGGGLLRREGDGVLCLACADLDGLEFLPSGDAALTRRARKYSTLQAVVVEWSRSRQRYERQGVLVEPAALLKAEEECLKDADQRARQRLRAALQRDELDQSFVSKFASAIQSAYPSCPPAEAGQIADHACRRNSRRIGRTAAAKKFDPDAIRLAVVAHIRHTHTNYDRLLNQLWDRRTARDEVREAVSTVLSQWADPMQPGPR